jgi:uncharacterized glyoxalase superfamily protein PhnB
MASNVETALQAMYISPSITVNDLQRSIQFYEGLGFGIEEKWENEGVLVGVMVRAGDARIGISQDDWKKGRDRVKGVGMRIYLGTTQDIDQLAARAKAEGITLDSEPEETPWGSRAFQVTDPDGFKLTLSTQS